MYAINKSITARLSLCASVGLCLFGFAAKSHAEICNLEPAGRRPILDHAGKITRFVEHLFGVGIEGPSGHPTEYRIQFKDGY